MAIHRGIQSALFFYLSCAPCSEARIRKKRKQEAVWNRAERDALEEENPDLYRHPEPSSTNPYWQNEISLGPAMNPNRRKGKNGRKSPREPGVLSSRASAADMDVHGNVQREDEELWGNTQALDGAGSVLQRPQRARTRPRGKSNETTTTQGTASTTAYQNFRSPPVSDLLPPIVRTVHSREEVAWMMQPPPVADFMSGKGGISRSVSSRQGTARTISRGSSGAASTLRDSPRTIPLDRRPSTRGDNSESTLALATSGLAPVRRVASRPPLLSTIASENNVPTSEIVDLTKVDSGSSNTMQKSKTLPAEKARPRPRARSNSDPRKLGKLHGRIYTTNFDSSPPDSAASPETEGDLMMRPELFDSWYTPEFELGRWVHEHTRREGIKERWSFDY